MLVHPRVVLTAAHCADQPLTHALLGASHIPPDTDGAVVAIQKVFVHEGWDRAAKVKNDLALLVLAEAAAVEPVRIASPGQLAAAAEVELVGFGYADPVRWTGLGEKRRVTVQLGVLRTGDEDLSALEDRYGFSSAHELVAGRKGLGKDACNGDSGGPAYVQVAGGGWRLAGITSRATDDRTAACGDGGVYVRPDRYLDWIGGTLAKAGIQL